MLANLVLHDRAPYYFATPRVAMIRLPEVAVGGYRMIGDKFYVDRLPFVGTLAHFPEI